MAKNGLIARRPPLTDRQKQMMLMVLMRHLHAFRTVKEKLSPAHFAEHEQGYALVWQVVLDYYQEFTELPKEEYVLGEVERRLGEDPDLLTPRATKQLDRFIDLAYSVPKKDLKANVAISFVQAFLQDHLAEELAQTIRQDDTTPVQLTDIFTRARDEAASISAMQSESVREPFPTGWKLQTFEKRSTGISFFDYFLNGGHADGEVYGILGPYASCKTTLAVQLSITAAEMDYTAWKVGGCQGPMPVAYAFFYEEAINPNILVRALSHAAMIPRDSLEDAKSWEKLSTSADLKPYEKKMYAAELAAGLTVMGEKERLEHYQQILNRNWRPVDMSGSDLNNPGRGYGMVPEVSGILRNDMATNNIRPSCVILDYVGAACELHVQHTGSDHGELRHLIGKFPLAVKNQIAQPYRCPVWLFHQLTGAANSKSSGSRQHHTDAAEAKNFAENLDFALAIGIKDQNSQCTLSGTKSRRSASVGEAILYIDGAFSRVIDKSKEMLFDATSNKIVPKREYNQIVDTRTTTSDARPRQAGNTMRVIGGL